VGMFLIGTLLLNGCRLADAIFSDFSRFGGESVVGLGNVTVKVIGAGLDGTDCQSEGCTERKQCREEKLSHSILR
jgi:hypothetical protein